MFLNKLGNIKMGGTENGLPQQFSQLFVTKASKKGEEKFEPFNDSYKEGVDSIKVMLPFIKNINKNFDSGLISFVILNESEKYYAKDIQGDILLFPLQPNFKNPNVDLPIVKLGKTEDWLTKLDMKNRAILYLYVVKDNNNLGIEFEGDSAGIFMFKTASAHSIKDIKNTLSLLNGVDKICLRLSTLRLEVHTKMLNLGKIEEVSYARLMPPSLNSIALSASINKNFPQISKYLEILESNETKQREEAIKNALSLEEAEKFFGKKIVFKLDQEFGFDLTPNENTKKIDSPEKKEIQNQAEELSKKTNLPVLVLKSLISKVGLEKAKKTLETKKTAEEIIKFISE